MATDCKKGTRMASAAATPLSAGLAGREMCGRYLLKGG